MVAENIRHISPAAFNVFVPHSQLFIFTLHSSLTQRAQVLRHGVPGTPSWPHRGGSLCRAAEAFISRRSYKVIFHVLFRRTWTSSFPIGVIRFSPKSRSDPRHHSTKFISKRLTCPIRSGFGVIFWTARKFPRSDLEFIRKNFSRSTKASRSQSFSVRRFSVHFWEAREYKLPRSQKIFPFRNSEMNGEVFTFPGLKNKTFIPKRPV